MVTLASNTINLSVGGGGWKTVGTADADQFRTLSGDTISNWTLMGWFDFDSTLNTRTTLGQGAGISLDGSTNGSGDRDLAMLGYAIGSGNDGIPYMGPNFSDMVGRGRTPVWDQGPIHLAQTITRDTGTIVEVRTYVNGVPIHTSTETDITTAAPQKLLYGDCSIAFNELEAGQKYANIKWFERALSDAEISTIYLRERTALGVTAPKMLVIGSFDSLTAFADAPFQQLHADTGLVPGCHFMLDAIGGSAYNKGNDNDYNNADRQGLRRAALQYGAKHYQKVFWFCQYGTNDLAAGVMDPGTSTWQAGRDLIDAMIFADIATVASSDQSKVNSVLITIPAHGGWLTPTTDEETARLAYNQDCRDNYMTRGYDYLIDWSTYTPVGWTDLEEAADDAATSGVDNDVYQLGGVHWSGTGGQNAADAVLSPFLAARLAEI